MTNNDSHKNDTFRCRTWDEVAVLYNQRFGEDLTKRQVRDIGVRAAKKLVKLIRKPENHGLRQSLLAEGLSV